MFSLMSPRVPRLAATLLAGLTLNLATPVLAPDSLGFVTAAQAQEPSQFASILANYGTFQAHAKYGEVWIPARTTVPEGWHPYPACNWVYTKQLGWYFNDKTEWGRIVHHYGRWAHDKELGWIWVRGEEFSPGWVVWRTSEKWVGWAPLPPDQDIREISATEFNNDKHWTFMDAKTFGAGCGGTTVVSTPPALYPVIFEETRLITEIKLVGGIAIFVLPPPLIINIIDIDIGVFHPWSPCFFGAWFWNWNWIVNNVVINVNLPPPNCPMPVAPMVKPVLPIKSTPPPPPGSSPPPASKPDRRAELPSPGQPLVPPAVGNPGSGSPQRPIDPGFVRPIPPKDRIVTPVPDRPKLPPVVTLPERPRKPPVIVDQTPRQPKLPEISRVPGKVPLRPETSSNANGPNGLSPAGRRPVPKLVREQFHPVRAKVTAIQRQSPSSASQSNVR